MTKIVSMITRPDNSKSNLYHWKEQGYTQVIFKAHYNCCLKECRPLDGNIYLIEDLLTFDNPKYRTSHCNCICDFQPYGVKKTETPKNWWEKAKEKGKGIWEKTKEKGRDVWDWFKRKKSSQDYKRNIYKEARRIKSSRDYKNKILKTAKWI